MAYSGSTAASSVANPPVRISHGALSMRSVDESTSVASGGQLWYYNSTNLTSALWSTTFFSDGKTLGMRPGDAIISVSHTTESSTGIILQINVVSNVSSAGAGVSTEAYISSTASGGS